MVCDITDSGRVIESLAERLTGRYLADDVVHPETGEVLATREKDDRRKDCTEDRRCRHHTG